MLWSWAQVLSLQQIPKSHDQWYSFLLYPSHYLWCAPGQHLAPSCSSFTFQTKPLLPLSKCSLMTLNALKASTPFRTTYSYNVIWMPSDWSKAWQLPFNTSKCKYMSFSPPYPSQQLQLCLPPQLHPHPVYQHSPWPRYHHLKQPFLEPSLYWNHLQRHIMSNCLSPPTKLTIYCSLICSKLTYSSQVWCPHLPRDIKSLEKVQHQATKYILHDFSCNYKDRLTTLKLPLSLWLDLTFPSTASKTHRTTLTSSTMSNSILITSKLWLITPFPNNHTNFHYFHRIVPLWNSLPAIDLSMSIAKIKHKLKQYLWKYFLDTFALTALLKLFSPVPQIYCATSCMKSLFV